MALPQGDTEAAGLGSQRSVGLGAAPCCSCPWSWARHWAPSSCGQGMLSTGLGTPLPLCGPWGCKGGAGAVLWPPWPQAERFCLGIFKTKILFLFKMGVHWETHCVCSAGKTRLSETFNSARGGFPQPPQSAQRCSSPHSSACPILTCTVSRAVTKHRRQHRPAPRYI